MVNICWQLDWIWNQHTSVWVSEGVTWKDYCALPWVQPRENIPQYVCDNRDALFTANLKQDAGGTAKPTVATLRLTWK